MLVYTNRGKQVKLNSNDVESIDVIVKDVVGSPFVPEQYVYSFFKSKNQSKISNSNYN